MYGDFFSSFGGVPARGEPCSQHKTKKHRYKQVITVSNITKQIKELKMFYYYAGIIIYLFFKTVFLPHFEQPQLGAGFSSTDTGTIARLSSRSP